MMRKMPDRTAYGHSVKEYSRYIDALVTNTNDKSEFYDKHGIKISFKEIYANDYDFEDVEYCYIDTETTLKALQARYSKYILVPWDTGYWVWDTDWYKISKYEFYTSLKEIKPYDTPRIFYR